MKKLMNNKLYKIRLNLNPRNKNVLRSPFAINGKTIIGYSPGAVHTP